MKANITLLFLVILLLGCCLRKSSLDKVSKVTNLDSLSTSSTQLKIDERLRQLEVNNKVTEEGEKTISRTFNPDGSLKNETIRYRHKNTTDKGSKDTQQSKAVDSTTHAETELHKDSKDTSKKKDTSKDSTVSTSLGGGWYVLGIVLIVAGVIAYKLTR